MWRPMSLMLFQLPNDKNVGAVCLPSHSGLQLDRPPLMSHISCPPSSVGPVRCNRHEHLNHHIQVHA